MGDTERSPGDIRLKRYRKIRWRRREIREDKIQRYTEVVGETGSSGMKDIKEIHGRYEGGQRKV